MVLTGYSVDRCQKTECKTFYIRVSVGVITSPIVFHFHSAPLMTSSLIGFFSLTLVRVVPGVTTWVGGLILEYRCLYILFARTCICLPLSILIRVEYNMLLPLYFNSIKCCPCPYLVIFENVPDKRVASPQCLAW